MKDDRGFMIACIALIVIVAIATFNSCYACSADIGTANTDVYVRRIDDGSVSGSLYKGDSVIVNGIKNGWVKVSIGDHKYKVWGEYIDIEKGVCLDGVKLVSKKRKSKSGGSCVMNKKKMSIKGSIFDGMEYW